MNTFLYGRMTDELWTHFNGVGPLVIKMGGKKGDNYYVSMKCTMYCFKALILSAGLLIPDLFLIFYREF